MTHSSDFSEEDAKQIENLVKVINATTGSNTVEVRQDKEDDSYLTVLLDGEENLDICHDTIGVFSYLKGMLDGIKKHIALQKNLADQKTFYIVREDFSNALIDSFYPREVILTSVFEEAKKRFEIAKEECKWHAKEDGFIIDKDTSNELYMSSKKLGRWKKISLIKAMALQGD